MKRLIALVALALFGAGALGFCGFAQDVSDACRKSLFRTEEQDLLLHKKLLAEKDSIVAVLLQEQSRSQQGGYSGRAVGEIPLEEGISQYGARTYKIKIPTAAGFHFVPSVSLEYNSQVAEGWAGYGWDIQGVPTITIINKSKYYHEVAEGARISETGSVFALDGIPLVRNIQADTMSDYPLVTACGNILASPVTNVFGYVTSFIVAYPNGVLASFGSEGPLFSNQQSYPVTQMTDMDGNKIVFSYLSDQSNGTKRLDTIKYGYDSSDNNQAEISFHYTQLNDYVSRNYAGKASYRNYRLELIVSKDGNSEICRFPLFYEQADNVHLLNRVECASGRDTLRPLLFNYGYESLTYLPPAYYLSKGQGRLLLANYANNTYEYVYKRGKFAYRSNNDGFLMYRKAKNYEIINYHTWNGKYYPDYGSPYPSNWKILYAPSVSDFTNMYDTITAGSGFQTIESVDVDGDGLDELVKVNFNGTTGSSTILRITVYKSEDGGAPVQSAQFDIPVEGVITSGNEDFPCRREYFWGDFLGNGKVQLATIAYDKNYTLSGPEQSQNSNTVLIDIAGQEKLFDSQLFIFPLNGPQRLIACDLDNDSQTELCFGTNTGLKTYRYSGNSFQLERTYMLLTDSVLASNTNPCYITDINGDGYIDVMRAPSVNSGNNWTRYSFSGSSFSLSYISLGTRETDDTFFFIDLNRDGLSDIIKINGTNVGTFMNLNGSSFDQYQEQVVTVSNPRGIIPCNVVDYCGMSSFMMIDGSYAYPFKYHRISPEMRQIIKSVDSCGRLLLNIYSFLPQNSRDWCDSTSTIDNADGYAFKTLPIYVLAQEERYDKDSYPRVKYAEKSYWYYDGVIHHLGLGFCGFSKIRSIDSITSPLEISDSFYDPMKRGVLTRSSTKHNFNGTSLLTTTNTYDNHTTTYGKLNPRLTQSVVADSLTGITTYTSYTYGSFDLPASVSTAKVLGSGMPKTETLNFTYQNSLSPTKYLIGAVTCELLRQEADGNPSANWYTRKIYTYDSIFHKTSENTYVGVSGGINLVSSTLWTYDSHGNVTSEKTAPYGATEFVGDTLVYDSAGRFLLSKTDALGRTTSYWNYNNFGSPSVITDFHNQNTVYIYDNWNNLEEVDYPDGSIEQTHKIWGGDGLYTVTNTTTGCPETVTHYDALCREIKSGVKRFDGVWQFTHKEYDSRGRLSRVSLPYRATTGITGPSYWNLYHYDIYDRPDSLCEASGRVTRWSYNGTSTTTVKDSIAITKTTDAMGRVVSVSDLGGTVTYTLRDDGQPTSITAPGNVVTTYTYDEYGRRTHMVDPSLGTEADSYTWNADGSSQQTHTNRNGTVTTFKDKYGRVTQVQRANEFNTTYTYDTYGRISSVISTNGTAKRYTYDDHDRIVSVKDSVPDGKWLQKDYYYRTGSVVDSIRYTCQSGYITTERYSYANGHNTGITLPDGTAVWSLVSENELGQPTEITTGGISREYGYTAFGLPTFRKMDGGAAQDFTYQFDPKTGNLLSRSGNPDPAESFTYDGLGRLTSITAGGETRQITYASNGNITAIDGAGSMIYSIQPGNDPYEVMLFRPEAGVPAHRMRSVTYNSFDRPATISEGDHQASITYDGTGDKVLTTVDELGTGTILKRYYLSGRYEHETESAIPTERLYLGGDAYSAPMVLQRTGANGAWTLYNIGRDYLGSITDITDADNTSFSRHYRYDPWGNLTNYSSREVQPCFLGRGFTGHEHLPWFDLINANARLYDPILGRFLSPDPYVQNPDFSQNYNRYSYCLNNPLKYTDESGEIIGTALTALLGFPIAFIYGGVIAPTVSLFNLQLGNKMTENAWKTYCYKVSNAWKIDMAPFQTDENLSEGKRVWSVFSRFTWEFPQTFAGNAISHLRNFFSDVDITYYNGATLVNTNDKSNNWSGMTLGSYINGINLTADPEKNDVFAHEYGHTKQSELLGPLYIPIVGSPSLLGSVSDHFGWSDHDREWYEIWANQLSYNYFKEHDYTDVVTNWSARNSLTQNLDWYIYPTIARYFRLALALIIVII